MPSAGQTPDFQRKAFALVRQASPSKAWAGSPCHRPGHGGCDGAGPVSRVGPWAGRLSAGLAAPLTRSPRPPRLFPAAGGAFRDGGGIGGLGVHSTLDRGARAGQGPPARRLAKPARQDALPPAPTATTNRKPLLSLRFVGCSLLRYEERRLTSALLFQEPPRSTRAMPPPFPIPSGRPSRVGCVDEKSKGAFSRKISTATRSGG